jgi:hypothetical protein
MDNEHRQSAGLAVQLIRLVENTLSYLAGRRYYLLVRPFQASLRCVIGRLLMLHIKYLDLAILLSGVPELRSIQKICPVEISFRQV